MNQEDIGKPKDFSEVKRRLEQAKQEIAWMLAILRDAESALKDYALSADQKQQIVEESLKGMTELLLPLAQELAKQQSTPVESVTLKQVEDLNLWQYNFGKFIEPDEVIRIEVVGPGGGPRRPPKGGGSRWPTAGWNLSEDDVIGPGGGPRRPSTSRPTNEAEDIS